MIGYIAQVGKKSVVPIEVRKSKLNKQVLLSIRKRFLEQGCRCGELDLAKLECHHKHNKLYNIGELIFVNCVPEILLEELKKCEVICKKCHDMAHPNRDERNNLLYQGKWA